ncbi:MAG: hypothetical protein JNK12_22980 [Acidimicrobiales bacterium]|nr:hypothetical protein [Acidimicrobiales bacterium]
MAQRPAVRWAAIAMAALLVVALVAGVAASIGGGGADGASSTTTGPPATQSTVPRDGDPAFCAAIVDFQDAYVAVGEPDPASTPAEVEADWDSLATASGELTETAPADMSTFVTPVVSAFDTLRQDADAVGYDYENFDSLASAATIDPDGSIAQSAYVLFTYEADRCPEPAATTDTTAAAAG